MQEVYFEDIQEKIISKIKNAENALLIAVAWLTDKQIIHCLEESLKKGCKVLIVLNDDNINVKENYISLHSKGAKIKFSRNLMHNKFCVIDDFILINGSYNWTHNAKFNKENITITYDLNNCEAFKQQFYLLFEKGIDIKYFIKTKEDAFEDFITENNIPLDFPYFYKKEIFNPLSKKLELKYFYVENYDDIRKISTIEKSYSFFLDNTNTILKNYILNKQKNLIIPEKEKKEFQNKPLSFEMVLGDFDIKNDILHPKSNLTVLINGGNAFFFNLFNGFYKFFEYDIIDINGNFCSYFSKKLIILFSKEFIDLKDNHFEEVYTLENEKKLICKLNGYYGMLDYDKNIIVDFFNTTYFYENNRHHFIETNFFKVEEITFFFKKTRLLTPQYRKISTSELKHPKIYYGSHIETIVDFNKNEISRKYNGTQESHFLSFEDGKYKNLYLSLLENQKKKYITIDESKFPEILNFYSKNKSVYETEKKFDLI